MDGAAGLGNVLMHDPRVIATYEVADNVRVNAQASKGFRLGGVNDPLNLPICDGGVPNGPDARNQTDDQSAGPFDEREDAEDAHLLPGVQERGLADLRVGSFQQRPQPG